jgi:hypothetical protein
MPRRGWDLLPFDEEVFWKVRRVPDRAVGEAAAEVPRSEVFRVTKQSRK